LGLLHAYKLNHSSCGAHLLLTASSSNPQYHMHSAPPYTPTKPVPRLVPLPPRHTLPVKRRDRLDAAAFGALREDNLQLVITANVSTP